MTKRILVTKTCPRCQTTKPRSDFNRSRDCSDGHSAVCRDCRKLEQKAYRDRLAARNPPASAAPFRRCPRCQVTKPAEDFYISRSHSSGLATFCKQCTYWKWVERNYALSEAEYRDLLAGQGGVCKICSRPPTAQAARSLLCVDHDHATGRVRGLLCFHCNAAIGQFADDPGRLATAIAYLRAA